MNFYQEGVLTFFWRPSNNVSIAVKNFCPTEIYLQRSIFCIRPKIIAQNHVIASDVIITCLINNCSWKDKPQLDKAWRVIGSLLKRSQT